MCEHHANLTADHDPLPLTLSIKLPSTKTTVELWNSFTFGFTFTLPEMIRAGRSSFTTGICAETLKKERAGGEREERVCPRTCSIDPWVTYYLKLVSCYPWRGFRPYNLWSNAMFSFFSRFLVIHKGKSLLISQVMREEPMRSPGRPPSPTRPITQAPVRVLRYTCRSDRHTGEWAFRTQSQVQVFNVQEVWLPSQQPYWFPQRDLLQSSRSRSPPLASPVDLQHFDTSSCGNMCL